MRVALLLLALVAAAAARIITFSNTDKLSEHTHFHQDTLYGSHGNIKAKRPFIEFQVTCQDTPNARVSWLVVHTNVLGIAPHVLSNYTDPDAGANAEPKQILSALCMEKLPKDLECEGTPTTSGRRTRSLRRYRVRRDTTTAAPATTTAAAKATTTGAAGTTTAPRKKDIPMQTAEDGTAYCHAESGLTYWHVDSSQVIGGCFICAEHHGTNHTIKAPYLPHDGFYTLWIESWYPGQTFKQGPRITGKSTFMNQDGYLSATLYPLMEFFGAMSLLYLGIGLLWVVLLACHYHDLLHLQFWIGGVIGMGMVEMAVSYGDLEFINSHGTRSQFLMVFSKLLLAGKNTLARLLVLVVSMGYGVVKPRLGGAWKQIVAMGCSYFFFAAAYAVTHAVGQTDSNESKTEMMVIIPLSVLDAAIIWWIFLSLSHTMKILTLRRNEIKLRMYTRFKWVLVFCVSATFVFAVWTLYDKFSPEEVGDWENAWWQDSFWHMLFFIILIAIMYLWRPTTNNSRYAYAPLETDLDDDEDFQVVPNFSSDAMKLRKLANNSDSASANNDVEDDLKWVEENIPSSMPLSSDNTFPNYPMDSDEELMHTRFEMSKMD